LGFAGLVRFTIASGGGANNSIRPERDATLDRPVMINQPWLRQRLTELKLGFMFLTRLPLRHDAAVAKGELAQALWVAPLAGVVVALIGALVFSAALALNVPLLPAAVLTVAATVAVTGGLHEDGLADVADGFGGGATRERKLEIMRDSRIGTYGVSALILSFMLRVCAIAELGDDAAVVAALIAAHAGGRACIPLFMQIVPAARTDGLAADAGVPPSEVSFAAAAIGIAALIVGLGIKAAILSVVLLAAAGALIAWLSWRQIQGQTGDVLGALEQSGEMIVLLVAAALVAMPR
jgi:adenosylcobinamide-GDP ribazoletransferase